MSNPINFSPSGVQDLQREVVVLLKAALVNRGVDVRASGGSIGFNEATLKFTFKAAGEEAERAAFARSAALFGCKAEDYGRVATINGKEVTLVGWELSRRKFPVRCRENKTGKETLFTEDVLHRHFHTGRAIG